MNIQQSSDVLTERKPNLRRSVSRSESVESLELRLSDGYHRIDMAVAQGDDVTLWEDFWIDLLHWYEALCDGAQVAA